MKIFLVEDHQSLLQTLQVSLSEAGFDVVGTLTDSVGALEAIVASGADVVLLDHTLPSGLGVDLIEPLVEAVPGITVLMLTMHADSSIVELALSKGAGGYLVKTASFADVLDAIGDAAEGKLVLSPDVLQGFLRTEQHELPTDSVTGTYKPKPLLTFSERDLLLLTAEQGVSQTARMLHYSRWTIKKRLGTIYRKLGVSRLADALVVATKRGEIVLTKPEDNNN